MKFPIEVENPMPEFKAEVPHTLTREDAFARLRKFGDQMRQSYSNQLSDLTEEWHDDGRFDFSFRVMGLSISGTMVASDEKVEVVGNLPFAALPFRGQLENEVRSQLETALADEN